ncbi:metalloregulator ArsR/SmtB family transcription factor [Acidovorax sp. JG5]|uniref:ArsR/SmtB family transcription factor n=1 Tax=Acidovorax sp. JG5 TaxID=2822718 RepID=UPI001FF09AC8|nr:metalloregulator ArsR/SmtB family transcription factor [Acidovorax sp. JG5]
MMKEEQALTSFAAISQETRLRIVRLLVVAGAEGLSAGAIAEKLGGSVVPRISFHLSQLDHAGLIESRRNGRFIVYSAIFPALSDLVAFLMHDCCQGHCQYCDRAISLFAKCEGRPATVAPVGRD